MMLNNSVKKLLLSVAATGMLFSVTAIGSSNANAASLKHSIRCAAVSYIPGRYTHTKIGTWKALGGANGGTIIKAGSNVYHIIKHPAAAPHSYIFKVKGKSTYYASAQRPVTVSKRARHHVRVNKHRRKKSRRRSNRRRKYRRRSHKHMRRHARY